MFIMFSKFSVLSHYHGLNSSKHKVQMRLMMVPGGKSGNHQSYYYSTFSANHKCLYKKVPEPETSQIIQWMLKHFTGLVKILTSWWH